MQLDNSCPKIIISIRWSMKARYIQTLAYFIQEGKISNLRKIKALLKIFDSNGEFSIKLKTNFAELTAEYHSEIINLEKDIIYQALYDSRNGEFEVRVDYIAFVVRFLKQYNPKVNDLDLYFSSVICYGFNEKDYYNSFHLYSYKDLPYIPKRTCDCCGEFHDEFEQKKFYDRVENVLCELQGSLLNYRNYYKRFVDKKNNKSFLGITSL